MKSLLTTLFYLFLIFPLFGQSSIELEFLLGGNYSTAYENTESPINDAGQKSFATGFAIHKPIHKNWNLRYQLHYERKGWKNFDEQFEPDTRIPVDFTSKTLLDYIVLSPMIEGNFRFIHPFFGSYIGIKFHSDIKTSPFRTNIFTLDTYFPHAAPIVDWG